MKPTRPHCLVLVLTPLSVPDLSWSTVSCQCLACMVHRLTVVVHCLVDIRLHWSLGEVGEVGVPKYCYPAGHEVCVGGEGQEGQDMTGREKDRTGRTISEQWPEEVL